MAEVAQGNKTTEWKAWIVSIASALVMGLGAFLSSGMLPDDQPLFKVLTVVAGLAATMLGVSLPTMKYMAGRAAVKAAASVSDPK